LTVLAASAACALRGARTTTRATTIALLPAPDGAAGRANVSNPRGAVDLNQARQATRIAADGAPAAPGLLDEEEIQQLFGDALSAMPMPPQRWVLRFLFDSDELTNESRALLPDVLRLVRERPTPEVTVVGHTDTMGADEANQQLGLRRAAAVRRLLLDAGVEVALIEMTSHGEADPLVTTPDETSEPANRRVEISLR
jgi:outer membrane protein OmpA-like peptidoglycan-associated protein